MFKDFFGLLLSNKELFNQFPLKDLFNALKRNKRDDVVTSYAETLRSIQKLVETNKKTFDSCQHPSFIVSIILFLCKLKKKKIPEIPEIIDKSHIPQQNHE